MRRLALLLAALALAAPAAEAQRRPARAPAAADWLARITVTPSGSYVRGNPAAKVKLVEYASFTCSHCAAFQGEAKAGLEQMIRSGQLSFEIRHAIRDRFDLAAALLARCQGPATYFRVADGVFAQQPQWLARAASAAEPAATQSMSDALVASARATGLDRIAAPGLPPARTAQCIGNAAEQGRLARMRDEAWNERRISGTPFFLVNGQAPANVYDWATLEPVLRAAIAQ